MKVHVVNGVLSGDLCSLKTISLLGALSQTDEPSKVYA